MFPLEQTVLPTALVPLHIFEPRYRDLARVVTRQAEPEFGIVMIERGREVGGEDHRSDIGVVARVVEAEEFDDGRWAIIATATRRVRVGDWLPDDPFPRALVTDWPDSDGGQGGADSAAVDLGELQSLLDRAAAAARRLDPTGALPSLTLADDAAQAIWQSAVLTGFGPLDAMSLLRAEGVAVRFPLARELLIERVEMVEALADEAG